MEMINVKKEGISSDRWTQKGGRENMGTTTAIAANPTTQWCVKDLKIQDRIKL